MNRARQSADEPVEAILESCRLRLAQGESIEACLADYPAHAAELAPLLPVMIKAQELASDPDPRYAAAARRRFQSSVATAKQSRARAARPSGLVGWLAKLAVPLALVLVLSLSGLELVQASDGSLPDSPLYPVKQATEKVGGLLATSPAARAVFEARLANTRRSELESAETMKKGPGIILVLAQSMVASSNMATEQALLTQGQTRATIVAHLNPILTAEQHDLGVLAADPRPQFAARGRGLEQQVSADLAKLATP